MPDEWDILSMGECMVEFFPDPAGSDQYRRSFGGDTLNAVAMAAKLGSRCAYVTRIADDLFGKFLRDSISSLGVDLETTFSASGSNGLYFIAVDSHGERHFQYYRSGSAASTLSPADVRPRWIENSRVILASGITQAISQSAAGAVQRALDLAHEKRRPVAYDVNFRRKLWHADQASRHLSQIAPLLQILFFSTEEISIVQSALNARLPDVHLIVDACWLKGISLVVVKQGERGVLLGDKSTGKIVPLRPLSIEVMDTSGAGDTFNGAFLHCFCRGMKGIECARWGVAASALQVGRHGTVSAMPSLEEVVKAVERVEV
ncbi:MAG TPA: sugar kinase [Acidobacteriota bacterium]|jgi:2-dehydro-3-deoxygluconokinase